MNKPIAFFEAAFRPFFLFAGLDSVANMALWLWAYLQPDIWPSHAIPAIYWHAHEMLFGFAGAAIAGFLLTAVPNWTGRPPYRGAVLWLLSCLWLGGRIALLPFPVLPPAAGKVIALSFYPVLGLTVAPSLLKARKYRNLPFLLLLGLLFTADLCFQGGFSFSPQLGQHIGLYAALDVALVMITIIGGRIIPNFTRNALGKQGMRVTVQSRPWLERGAILSLVIMVALDMTLPLSRTSGAAALVAGLFQAARLSQWQGHRTLRDPLLWVLHLGYAWLAFGLLLKAAALLQGTPLADKWLHALTVGTIGTMILAVMSRAALGHSGRPLVAQRPMSVSFLLVSVAAGTRALLPALFPDHYDQIISLSGATWIAAFVIYLWVYTPIFLRPRQDGKPG